MSRAVPMADYLLAHEHIIGGYDVLHLNRQPTHPIEEVAGLTISPPAQFRARAELSEESAADWDELQLIETSLMHLEDPHVDALLALQGRQSRRQSLCPSGWRNRIDRHVYTAKAFRGQGVARTLMSRAMEIAPLAVQAHPGRRTRGKPRTGGLALHQLRLSPRWAVHDLSPKDIVRRLTSHKSSIYARILREHAQVQARPRVKTPRPATPRERSVVAPYWESSAKQNPAGDAVALP